MKYYKTLAPSGGSVLGRDDVFAEKTSSGRVPGPWVQIEGPLRIDHNSLVGDNGIHLAKRGRLVRFLCDDIFEAEYDGEILEVGYYSVARRVRLLRRLDAWNSDSAYLFAADCAEHVLPIFGRQNADYAVLGDAIRRIRDFVAGNATEDDIENAKTSALSIIDRTLDNTPAKSVTVCVYTLLDIEARSPAAVAREVAQTAAAARKATQRKWPRWLEWLRRLLRLADRDEIERAWQTKKLFEILECG